MILFFLRHLFLEYFVLIPKGEHFESTSEIRIFENFEILFKNIPRNGIPNKR